MQFFSLGDVHGDWSRFNTLLNKMQHDYEGEEVTIFQCGDWGYFPHWEGLQTVSGKLWNPHGVKLPKGFSLYTCGGNHEDWESLNGLIEVHGRENPIRLHEGKEVYFCPRGYVMQFPEFNVLFMGGADSIDKEVRIPGHSWFPGEVLTMRDFDAIPLDIRIDVVISHTVPLSFAKDYMGRSVYERLKHEDPSCTILDMVLEEFRPSYWFAGHWHRFASKMHKACDFTVLGELGGSPYIVQLPF